MQTDSTVPLDSGVPVAGASPVSVLAPRLVPPAAAPAPLPLPATAPKAALGSSSGAVAPRPLAPEAVPVSWFDDKLSIAVGDIHGLEIMSPVAFECGFRVVRVDSIDENGLMVVIPVTNIRIAFLARVNNDSSFSRARLVCGSLSVKK